MTSVAMLEPVEEKTPRKKKLSVLVLDDNEFDRKRLERLIQGLDNSVDVSSCSNLLEFEQRLLCTAVDICIVDHQLGEASGVDAVEVVQQRFGLHKVPVVMISGHEDIDIIIESIKAGCIDYLSKKSLTAKKLHSAIFDAVSQTLYDPSWLKRLRKTTPGNIGVSSIEYIRGSKPRLN